ncbi:uncharacterized protein LOC132892995 isoform X3 [Neoarius graeffei]|uniref:uncharacterized protein LOC132892995 isoform X3 n=1 Tax=Neoarius graeffei TaxID=443677 RepID=UPI00298D0942|nr:uncharacterized protein LOC132892995 isoform X3 [Neoarius graeffei]
MGLVDPLHFGVLNSTQSNNLHVFGLWGKPEHPEETHADTGRTCKLCIERPRHADLNPENWYTPTKSNPSPLHDLKVQLTSLTGAPASPGLNITWSINIDSSIHSIQGTLIRVDKLEYRCQYQPQFTSKQVHTGDLEQLGFHFITTDFMIEPSGSYDVIAYNLPPAPLKVQHEYRKMAQIQVPGCDNEWMKDHSTCLNPPPTIKAVTPSPATTTEEPKEHETSVLLISIGCAVAIILLFICLFWRLWRKSGYSKHGLDTAGSVGVLVVYPAVDSMFQNVVMAIADFLQSYRELNVIIDVWQRGSLAEQGPLRWLHSQVSCAEKVLIILPPQHTEFSTNTACLKPNIASVTSDYTVPASACELFSLALNLVASCAHDSQQHQKFLVVHLDHGGQGRIMPVELRGCKTLILPRDLEKLHQLSSRRKVTISGCRSKSYPCKETARKVRDAVQQLDK